MTSYSENGVSFENRYASTVESFPRDQNSSPSSFMKPFNAPSDGNTGSSTVQQGPNIPNMRSGSVLNNFHSDKNKSNGLDKYQNSSVDITSGMSDARDASAIFMDGSFAENPDGSFNSWKKCQGDMQQNRCFLGNGSSESQMLGMHNDFNCRLFMQPDASLNRINVPSFPEGISSTSWCQNVWVDQNLGPGGDRNCVEWPKSFQDQFTEANSLFHPAFKSWRVRTSSDNGGLANKIPQPVARSGQSASETQSHHIHHKRRGRTASGSSNPPTDTSPNSEDNRSINLPSGQNVNSSDFDVPTCLSDTMAHMSIVSDISVGGGQRPPVMSTPNTSDTMTQFMLGGQALPNMDKPPFFVSNSSPDFWSVTSAAQEGVPTSMVFSQKVHPYQRSSTSEQYTQHDNLGSFRSTCGFSNSAAPFEFENNGLDQHLQQQQQQHQNQIQLMQGRDDDKLWYYEDPSGQIQGEFSSLQMNNWLMAGRYFTPALRIRRKCDENFSTLQDYYDLYGQVPFSSTLKVPPIRGVITPDLIACFRAFQNLGPTAANLIANLENDPAYQKLAAETGLSIMDIGFGKNGMNNTSANAVAATIAKLLGVPAPTVNFNDPSFSLLSEWIAKGRVDQLALQEVAAKVGSHPMGSSWPTPLQCQFLAQIQSLMQTQQSSNDKSLPTASHGVTANGAHSGDGTVPASSIDGIHVQPINPSPKASRHKSAGAVGAEISEPKLKKIPQQQPIGSKPVVAAESVNVNQQQYERSGRSRAAPQEQAQPQTVTPRQIKSCWTERGNMAVFRASAHESSQQLTSGKQPSFAPTSGKAAVAQNTEVTGGKKKSKQIPTALSNGGKKAENVGSNGASKKQKGTTSEPRTEELEALIQWVDQTLKGVERIMNVDIPTLVEFLVTIDGPYEVENVILTYFANTPRARQFVKDFLDRRHTCWQQHKKRMEEENQKKCQNGQRSSGSNTDTTNSPEGSGYGARVYQEVNESQAENAWRQIKPKGGFGRRGRKGAKNR